MKKWAFMILFLAVGGFVFPQGGYLEIGVHYSYWNIDIASKYIEDHFVPDFQYYNPEKGKFDFKSDGNNYGVELRFFPGGKNGSFSIGVSYEKNNFNAKINGTYNDTDGKGNTLKAEANGKMELIPHSINANLRWEIIPSGRIHPYFGIGFGIGKLNGTLSAHTRQTVYYQGSTTVQEADEIKTLKQVLDEEKAKGNDFPFNFFPIVQVQVGLRIEIVSNVYALAEGAVYDGLALRGGLSYRF